MRNAIHNGAPGIGHHVKDHASSPCDAPFTARQRHAVPGLSHHVTFHATSL